jgi:hypothetical protein
MSKQQQINKLWREFETSLEKCYTDAQSEARERQEYRNDYRDCLRDYAKASWNDALAKLVGAEASHERKYRGSNHSPIPAWFTVNIATKLLIMNNAADGTKLETMPEATIFLIMRDTAAEAVLIGWLARGYLSEQWKVEVKKLDYAELIKS